MYMYRFVHMYIYINVYWHLDVLAELFVLELLGADLRVRLEEALLHVLDLALLHLLTVLHLQVTDHVTRCKATWKRGFKLPWREAGPPNHHDDTREADAGEHLLAVLHLPIINRLWTTLLPRTIATSYCLPPSLALSLSRSLSHSLTLRGLAQAPSLASWPSKIASLTFQ